MNWKSEAKLAKTRLQIVQNRKFDIPIANRQKAETVAEFIARGGKIKKLKPKA